ncbi:MAG: YfiR family protein [Pseudomonadota bacterium]
MRSLLHKFTYPLGLTVVLLTSCFAVGLKAQDRDSQLKAAIVSKLPRYIDWPESAFSNSDAPLRVCSYGKSPVTEALVDAIGDVASGRVVQLLPIEKYDLALNCHLTYVATSEDERLQRVINDLDYQFVVTISEISDFAGRGGVIEIVRKGRRFGFRINLDLAERKGVRINSQLLGLSEVIGRSSSKEGS